jgi:cardiolipin synthase A/B
MPSSATASPTATAPQPQLLEGGEGFFPALVAALDAARDWVQLETYLFDFHGRGADVAEALVRAAQRGVTVQVLVDGIGSAHLADDAQPPSDADQMSSGPERLRAAGVQWQRYSPLTGRWPTLGILHPDQWRRLHRKLCVIDQQQVFCGGVNILDDFHDPNHGPLSAPRFDFTVAVHGPAAAVASEAMALLWWRVQAGYSAQQRHLTEAWEAFKAAGFGGRLRGLPAATRAKASGSQRTTAALLLRDNLLNRNTIERAYRRAIGQARQEILIANAYFLPGGRLRRALIKAARRGVKVTLLLQGKYEYFMQYHAARPVYGALLKAGVEIHEYEASFLHAKVAVVDGHWSTVGSSNLDPLSLLMAREANMVIDDRAFAAALRNRLYDAIEGHGRRMDASAYAGRPWRQRLLDQLAYALMRLALLLTRQRY